MSKNSFEIVHEGWLTKSPPTKPIWRARWRRRWFVLRHSGELPGQYFLEYYTDRNCRKLKGKIDLDQCEQVDAGLRFENNKQKYQHMFDVKTPKRIYYLAAESEEEMNKWVEFVCHVCGLKAYKDDEEEYECSRAGDEEEPASLAAAPLALPLALPSGDSTDPALSTSTESPPVSPTSTLSGPYIPISECISGKPLRNGFEEFNSAFRYGYSLAANAQYGLTEISSSQSWRAVGKNSRSSDSQRNVIVSSEDQQHPLPSKNNTIEMKFHEQAYEEYPLHLQQGECYDLPRKLHPPNLDPTSGGNHTPPICSPNDVGSGSVEEWSASARHPPSVNWKTFPEGDGISHTKVSDSSVDIELSTDIGSWSVKQRCGKYTIVDSAAPTVHCSRMPLTTLPVAPPRPPKPSHLSEMPSHNYLNLDNVSPKPTAVALANIPGIVFPSYGESDHSKRQENSCTNLSHPNNSASTMENVDPTEEPSSPKHCEIVTVPESDETYDFPRSHLPRTISEPDGNSVTAKFGSLSRHCYTNAAPGKLNGEIFRYDFQHSHSNANILMANETEEPNSPRSEGSGSVKSANVIYSNLPSPLSIQSASGVIEGNSGLPTPPAVNRGLKPGRKLSDSMSVVSSEPSPGGPVTAPTFPPPSVDRKLKPHWKYTEEHGGPIQLASPPTRRIGSDSTRSLRKPRAAPSPTPPSSMPAALGNGQKQRNDRNSSSDEDPRVSQEEEQIYYYQQDNRFIPAGPGKRLQEIQYLDLDLDADASSSNSSCPIPKSPERVPTTGTVYKTVDFVKTEAFNRTRQKVEEERNRGPDS